jgi:dihydropteroate synthase
MRFWQTSRRKIALDHTLVMAILNVTPDSFSDGGRYDDLSRSLFRVEAIVSEGADTIDIGGESTRPGSKSVPENVETDRVVPVIEAIRERFGIPISIDTSKSSVATAALGAGAEIVNDISGLRFDPQVAHVAAKHNAGLVLMHSRGDFEDMHRQPPVINIIEEVACDFRRSLAVAGRTGVNGDNIVLDVGIGFGKTLEQNLELIAKVDKLAREFPLFPILVGASRKSFIGRILDDAGTVDRLSASLAAAAIAAWNGANVVRVHDVKETVDCLKIVDAAKAAN